MLAILGLGNGELIIILVILLLMFGATKLPQLARGLGKSVKEFKKASSKEDSDDSEAEEEVGDKRQLSSRKAEDAEDALVEKPKAKKS